MLPRLTKSGALIVPCRVTSPGVTGSAVKRVNKGSAEYARWLPFVSGWSKLKSRPGDPPRKDTGRLRVT
jgi:hypothetical protein